jgi:hypothetical protein
MAARRPQVSFLGVRHFTSRHFTSTLFLGSGIFVRQAFLFGIFVRLGFLGSRAQKMGGAFAPPIVK